MDVGPIVWKIAQTNELSWWSSSSFIIMKYNEWVEKCIINRNNLFKSIFISDDDLNIYSILDIGCGGHPMLYGLPGKKVSIEPLWNRFKFRFKNKIKDFNVIVSSAEDAVLEDTFDMVIIKNVLDHCRDPNLVLKRIKSWMRDNSLLVLSIYVREKDFMPSHHPNQFHYKNDIVNLLLSNGFGGYFKCYKDVIYYFLLHKDSNSNIKMVDKNTKREDIFCF